MTSTDTEHKHSAWDARVSVLASQLLAESRSELERADGKAATLLSFLGLFVGVVLAGMIAGQWGPNALNGCWSTIWWIGVFFIAVAVALLGAAVWPRTKKTRLSESEGCVTYFGDVDPTWNMEKLGDALALTCSSLPNRDGEQLLTIAKVAQLKYRLVRWAIASCALGVVVAGSSAWFGH